ncbi:SDR family NAD(P)-dependent oxidoreductase [Candidatus Woesearchaeota archaeon]|nr:SDR family NAD(P)-dependent oxidoreductase [Candidatus Woesearchaeota archaeon]
MKTILITGCSSGIGLHCAIGLKKRGYRVLATARKKKDVKMLKGMGFDSFLLDVASSELIDKALGEILMKVGRIDFLFNNAGYVQPGAVEDLTRKSISGQFETNLFGAVELAAKTVRIMRKQGGGRIVWNSSVVGLLSMPYRSAYCATKFAMEAFSDALRIELMGTRIKSILIEPGPILTKLRHNAYIAFKKNIDEKNSVHRETYERMKKGLEKKGALNAFTLPPEAVLRKLIKAIESRKPRRRYYVTFPTYAVAVLKRILPSGLIDRLTWRI